MRKRPKFQHLSINALRRGEMRFATAYDAPEAARIAARMARSGWRVEVQSHRSLGTKRNIHMTCTPEIKQGKTVARCSIKPAFKKQLKASR